MGTPRPAPGPGPVGTRGIDGVPRGPFIHGAPGPFISNGGVVHGNRFVPGHGFVPAPFRFNHPYYAFRPRWNVGFGLWAGYPFAYPYGYYNPFYPYSYAAPYDYVPPPVSYESNSDSVQPSQANLGGLSFEITPGTAELFVDGQSVGTVDQFTPMTQPLGVGAGPHHIEVRAPGYRTMSFDVDIIAGQVIPYQGALEVE